MDTLLLDTLQGQIYQDTLLSVSQLPVSGLFDNHLLQTENNFLYIERAANNGSFSFLVLMVCAAIIVYLQRNSDGIFSAVLKASFDVNQAHQDARVENSQRSRNLFILQVVSAISIALFIAGMAVQLGVTSFSGSRVFFWALVALFIGVLLKRVLLWILAQLFSLNAELRLHRFNLSIFFSSTGLFLLPLSLFLFYSPQIPFTIVGYAGAAVALLFYLKTLHRGVSTAMVSSGISMLHLFYYFCALELLPFFVLIRIALQW